MFLNYLKVALRNLLRKKFYSTINILGLAIGLTCTILIGLFVQNELSFDKHHENYKRIYRLESHFTIQESDDFFAATAFPLGPALKLEFPQDVEEYCRFMTMDNNLFQIDEKKIFEDIKNIRNSVDLVIVSLHWGYEYVPFPSPEQVEIGRKLIDCGADIIFGGHPHVLQSYEIYKGKPLVYSLGNFIFDHTYIKNTRESIIAKIRVDRNTKDINIDIIPVICNSKEYYPKIAEGSDKNGIQSLVSEIRSKIENKSLVEYSSGVGDYPALANKYKRTAKMEMKKQFIKNLYRFPPKLSISIVKDYLQIFFG